jgi:transketolase
MFDIHAKESRAIHAIRFISADGVQKANSGHPGLPMGAAAMAYTIWTRHLRHSPRNPTWPGRDRFVLSGGHGSMLLYSLLYLTGYDLTLDDLKSFRQWGSRTPGHPERGITPGVEVTTGPLGQGFANGVGMAIAATHMGAEFNEPDYPLIDPYIFAIVTDGDLMEGISSEAASLAGHLRLGRLIYLYDDNRISIDGSTDLAFTEDRAARFVAYGWQVQLVADGNDVEAIDQAIRKAKLDYRPSLIVCKTQIGYGLPTRQGTEKAHGEPPGVEELKAAKQNSDWPLEPDFYVPQDILEEFRQAIPKGERLEQQWQKLLQSYCRVFPRKAVELERRLAGSLSEGWDHDLPAFPADAKGMASRVASGKVLNMFAGRVPEILGGSADLAPSNKTWIDGAASFQANTPSGRNFHFGVREHAMGGIVNGMAVFGGVIPYGGTFLVFSDYMRPAIRLSALSHYPSIWVFTHDSIGVGEDGPTHQPVEHLAALRSIPGLVLLRPGDANEVTQAWRLAINRRDGPTALIFSRQDLPTLDRSFYAPAVGVEKGAYVLADLGDGKPDLILMASGSELSLIVEAGKKLAASGINIRLVSFPSWELFAAQDEDYKESVLPAAIERRIAIEAGVPQGWERWVGSQGKILAIDHFGASAPYKTIYQAFGLSIENLVVAAEQLAGS